MDSVFISFILPCYNVEQYICDCLNSIFKCGLLEQEYEVLCYDDCSTDNTASLLEVLARSHRNIRVLKGNTNNGPGKGRNVCLKEARGKYVWFVDADDMIVSEAVVKLLEQSKQNNLDALAFNFEDIDEHRNVLDRPSVFNNTIVLSGLDFVEITLRNRIVFHMGFLCRFFLRREFLISNHLFFPEGVLYGEDTVIMLGILFCASRIQSNEIIAYQIRRHEYSTCGQFGKNIPARLIYERCVTTSSQLLDFTRELSGFAIVYNEPVYESYATIIRRYTRTHYLGMLPVFLFRTNRKERELFYLMEKEKRNEVKSLKRDMKALVKLLLMPSVGLLLAEVGAFLYGLTHKDKVVC